MFLCIISCVLNRLVMPDSLWPHIPCPPGSSVLGIFQARILGWVAIPFSRGPFWPRDWTQVPCIFRWVLYHWATWEASPPPPKLLQSCLTLYDPRDGSPPGSPHPWDSPGKNTGMDCHFRLQLGSLEHPVYMAPSRDLLKMQSLRLYPGP